MLVVENLLPSRYRIRPAAHGDGPLDDDVREMAVWIGENLMGWRLEGASKKQPCAGVWIDPETHRPVMHITLFDPVNNGNHTLMAMERLHEMGWTIWATNEPFRLPDPSTWEGGWLFELSSAPDEMYSAMHEEFGMAFCMAVKEAGGG